MKMYKDKQNGYKEMVRFPIDDFREFVELLIADDKSAVDFINDKNNKYCELMGKQVCPHICHIDAGGIDNFISVENRLENIPKTSHLTINLQTNNGLNSPAIKNPKAKMDTTDWSDDQINELIEKILRLYLDTTVEMNAAVPSDNNSKEKISAPWSFITGEIKKSYVIQNDRLRTVFKEKTWTRGQNLRNVITVTGIKTVK